MQILLSIAISFGLFSLKRFMRTFSDEFQKIRPRSSINDDQFSTFLSKELKRMGSSLSIVVGMPFGLGAIVTLLLVIMPKMPNTLFPVNPYSPLWIYSSIVEFSIEICTFLFGIAIWIGINTILLYKKMGKDPTFSIDPLYPDSCGGFKPLSKIILEGTVMYSVCITMTFSVISYSLYHYSQDFSAIFIIPILVEGTVVFTILLFFFIPQYFIHNLLSRKKDSFLIDVRKKSLKLIEELKREKEKKERHDYFEEGLFWLALADQVGRMHTWPFDIFILLKGVGSLAIPIATFIVKHFFLRIV